MIRAPAPAKINLALVVGRLDDRGRHEVASVLQRVDLADRVAVRTAERLQIEGYEDDTLVRGALERLAAAAGVPARWSVRIEKAVPVTAGLGGGSSDAATALVLANRSVAHPLAEAGLHDVAASLGSDVPFFLRSGPQLAVGDGTELTRLDLPQDFWVVLVLPRDQRKESTAAVYERFDRRNGADGYAERRALLLETLGRVRRPRDLAALPPNDLASSPLAAELLRLGAFRADVSGAGPIVYGLFQRRAAAQAARRACAVLGRTWLTVPAWYG